MKEFIKVRYQIGDQICHQALGQLSSYVLDDVWYEIHNKVMTRVWDRVLDQVGYKMLHLYSMTGKNQ